MSQNIFEVLEATVSCEELFMALGVSYRKDGTVFRFQYPGCNDGDSSYMYPETKKWRIDSKDMRGGLIDFTMMMVPTLTENYEAALYLADLLNIDVGEASSVKPTREVRAQRCIKRFVQMAAKALWEPEGKKALKAIRARGFCDDNIREMNLGYVGNKFPFHDLKADPDIPLNELGLRSEAGWSSFKDRVLMPSFYRSRVTALNGWDYHLQFMKAPVCKDNSDEARARYDEEFAVWKKRKSKKYRHNPASVYLTPTPFGLHTVKTDGIIAICEGGFDVMALREVGVDAIALTGSSSKIDILEAHREMLESCRSVFLFFDGDKSGRNTTQKIADKLMAYLPDVYVVDASESSVISFVTDEKSVYSMELSTFSAYYGRTPAQIRKKLASAGIKIDNEIANPAKAHVQLSRLGIRPISQLPFLKEDGGQTYDPNDILMQFGKDVLLKVMKNNRHALAVRAEQIEKESAFGTGDTKKLLSQYITAFTHMLPSDLIRHLSEADLSLSMTDLKDIVNRAVKEIAAPVRYAKALSDKYQFIWIDGRGLLSYDAAKGNWKQIDYNAALENLRKVVPLSSTIHDLWKKVKDELQASYCKAMDLMELRPYYERYIALKNGTFDIEKNKLVPHSPEHYCLHSLNFSYKENSSPDLFKMFLHNIFITPEEEQGEPDVKAAAGKKAHLWIDYMQEVIGLWMMPYNSLQRAWVFYGGGANGKGVLVEVLRALLGTHNTSYIDLYRMADAFSISTMEDKLLNIIPEFENRGGRIVGRELAQFKNIIGGEPVTSEKKYEAARASIITARIAMFCNDVPILGGSKYAAQRRMYRTKFHLPVTFHLDAKEDSGKIRVPIIDFDRKLLDTIDEIGSWCIDSISNLLGRFEEGGDLINVYEEEGEPSRLRSDISEFSMFCDDLLVQMEGWNTSTATNCIPLKDVRKAYYAWHKNASSGRTGKIYPETVNQLAIELTNFMEDEEHGELKQISVGKGRPSYYMCGWSLRPYESESQGRFDYN